MFCRNKQLETNKDMKKECYIIYGYKELGDRWKLKGLKHPRWYIGLTEKERKERRRKEHREFLRHNKGNGYWKNWVLKRESEGYLLEDVTEYHVLNDGFHATRKDAEDLERVYAESFDALYPNGFCSVAGGYSGRVCEETKKLMSRNRKGKGNTTMKMWSKDALERLEERKKETILRARIRKAKKRIAQEESFSKEDKIIHRVARLIIESDVPMQEIEINEKLGISRSIVALQRLCWLDKSTKMRKNPKVIRCLERIKIGKGTFYVAKPEFSSWMIGSQEYFKARRNRDWNIDSLMLASLGEKRIKPTGRPVKSPPTSWFINTAECLKEQAAEQMGISYARIQLLIRKGKLKEIRRPSKCGCKRFVCALSLKEEWRKRKTLTH